MATIAEALAQALQYHQAGQLAWAQQLYHQILVVDPANSAAWHYLGLLAHQQGEHPKALEYLQRALVFSAHKASYHYNLGLVYQNMGRTAEAKISYRRAVDLEPNSFDALMNMGKMLVGTEPSEAIACYRQALRLAPNVAEIQLELANVLSQQGHHDEAISCCREALRLRPNCAEAHRALGIALWNRHRQDEAITHFREAVRLQPESFGDHQNLGKALCEKGLLEEAIGSYRRVLDLQPNWAEGHSNLGCAFKAQGLMAEAIASFRRAVELQPQNATIHSNLVHALMYAPAYDDRAISEEHQRWNLAHAAPLAAPSFVHVNERVVDRRLKVGYVSPDFSMHSGRLLLPLLEAHDRRAFEVFGYSNVQAPDRMTDLCRAQCHVWRDIVALSDDQVARGIHEDRIDILVDLALHSAGNRLLVFARKPAPVQATYLGYPGSTGLTAMDYRLTDPYLDPPGGKLDCYAEVTYRLPHTFWCYDPRTEEPAVGPLPAMQKGVITFGCLNSLCKVNEDVLALWARVLHAVPGSGLLLLATEGSHRQRILGFLAQQRVASSRVEFVSHRPHLDYLALYHQIDIGLDTFPYSGHTTNLDSLWMGVPVISLIGRTVVGRGGLSILSNAGLPELAVSEAADYVRCAVELVKDLSWLRALRATLRQRLRGSPLMDAPSFARAIEAAYRSMWQAWCKHV